MVTPHDPAGVLFGRTRQDILALLFTRPDEAFYLREIVRRTGRGVGPVQRDLSRLVAGGMVKKEKDKFYRANAESPIYEPLKQIVIRTMGVADMLCNALAGIATDIAVAFIFGSFARGGPRESSDIDLMILTRENQPTLEKISGLLHPGQMILQREINPFVLPVKEFRKKWLARNHFVLQVLAGEKTFLLGNEDDLKRLAEKRLAQKPRNQPAGDRRSSRAGRSRSERLPNKGA